MAAQKAGFVIEGREYAFPESFRLGDPVLVSELTGLDFDDFAARMDDDELRSNPVVLIGLIGVSVWQGNPRWKRDRVIDYVQRIDLENFDTFGHEEAAEADPLPPAEEPATDLPSPPSDDLPVESDASRDES